MGCYESRKQSDGRIAFITREDFEKEKDEHKYIAVDCSWDIPTRKAKDFYKI